MCNYLKKIHNAQRIEFESGSHWPDNVGNEKVPYWRIIGAYGYISDENKIISREQCIKHLQSEGFIIEACGRGNMSRRVKDCKKHYYDLTQIPPERVLNTDIPKITFYTAMTDICSNPASYRAMSVDMLKHFANDQYGIENDTRLAQFAEYARDELSRRGMDPNKKE